MTVLGVEKETLLDEFANALEGEEYIIANVELKNTGEKKIPYNDMYFSMQNGNKAILNTSVDGAALKDNMKSGELAPGGVVTGRVVFESKQGDNDLTLIYKPMNFDNIEIKVALQ
ncbi:hypothetical protein COK86_19435 [Bacillus cereus]|uniref:DUF4352 domain-containing protein n=1 Tax=Bacillus cereus TaxID=1396 RepID=A0A2B3TZT6_BACCE|nr:DUF4352 domain-containing protein [Bacillus cereus]PFU40472.1 hypothetical protein COK86_19435 [Bacillus cereus]